ncbi:helix-turn-helix domain-containing protein [Sphaerimonospora mesophila]|uniref:helix-turn-helix domain-containing protein n=1 Tax=Sphaerimonospora mesophila TaxID=37483 RepID=UPI0009F9E2BB
MARWGCVTEPLLNFKQAAERLNIPESWLREKVAKRQVPHTRFGKHVRFTEADLAAIIEAGHQPAASSNGLPRRRGIPESRPGPVPPPTPAGTARGRRT